jgi:hydroxyethylthiazole kinase-like uncharacterized protein yjeF
MRVLSVAEARELDRDAVERLGMPSLLLMENAASAVATEARRLGRRALILAGPGNNGGDGLAAARHLGRRAVVHLLEAPDPTKCPDAALQLQILRRAGLPVVLGTLPPLEPGPDHVFVDALFGIGLARPLEGRARAWVEFFDAARGSKLAVDVPSGLDADTGLVHGVACHAEVTVTFEAPKRGMLVPGARPHVGRIVVAPLGLPGS